jgi:lipoprotein-releasing system permease protein
MKKSFSLMLAWRYLNPRRAWISSIVMISVGGVLLGVLVLVVVMAVFAGLEREQKQRLLGFSPHLLLEYSKDGLTTAAIENYGEEIDRAKLIPGVVFAYPHIEDIVVLDSGSMQRPVTYQAVETNEPEQMAGIEKILDLEHYPESTADMGLDARVVVSSLMADQFGWQLGDKINLYSTRNFQEVLKTYKSTEEPIVRERFAKEITAIRDLTEKQWLETSDGFTMNESMMNVLNEIFRLIELTDLRETEHLALQAMSKVVLDSQKNDADHTFHFAEGAKAQFLIPLEAILESKQDEMDATELKNLKSIVLPREVEIVGVFQAGMMMKMPDLFVPLPLAQGLSGLGDGVQGIALRIEDPYRAEEFRPMVEQTLTGNWRVVTWGEQFQQFFALISQQRVMMYFVLSFIGLISAFSMMAVMFTVTIQKKREIGVMKALGATQWQIMRVFLYQGIILGVVGSLLGVFLGRLIIYCRGPIQDFFQSFGFDPFASRLLGLPKLPAYMDPKEQFYIGLMGLLLCMFASIVPAFFAARSDAAKSLRNI